LVIGRLSFHAFFLPVFEGPDEPFHLGRVVAFAETSFSSAHLGVPLPPVVVSAVESHPCGPDLHRSFSCPPFDGTGAGFNVLQVTATRPSARTVENYENHQPPLYYWLMGALFRFARIATGRAPRIVESDLLFLRLLSVALVTLALLGPGRAIAAGWSDEMRAAVLLLLLVPGSSEALVRSSNDAALFLWCAALVAALARGAGAGPLFFLFAIGPLIKLTALPVIVMGVLYLCNSGRRRIAALSAVAAITVVPVQLLRGWRWGGTYELNVALPEIGGSLGSSLMGLLRSLYTFAKTIFWVGGWTFSRAPRPLVGAFFILIAVAAASVRVRRTRELVPHVVGVVAALGGVILLALTNRRLFGDWGGLGGWYFWGWFPWLSFAGARVCVVGRKAARSLLVAEAIFVLFGNVAYLARALRIYGV
jgi:hypothetical protein